MLTVLGLIRKAREQKWEDHSGLVTGAVGKTFHGKTAVPGINSEYRQGLYRVLPLSRDLHGVRVRIR